MHALTGPLFGFLLSGNYLLFWPVYRPLHPRKTQRRQALFKLFLVDLVIYASMTALLKF